MVINISKIIEKLEELKKDSDGVIPKIEAQSIEEAIKEVLEKAIKIGKFEGAQEILRLFIQKE